MTGLAIVLLVTIHATFPIPTGDFAMTSASEEIRVVLGHRGHMAFLAALIAVTHEALILIESP